jgi:hypothetical protein
MVVVAKAEPRIDGGGLKFLSVGKVLPGRAFHIDARVAQANDVVPE